MKDTLKVIIPVYNEEGAITEVVNDWTRKLQSLQIDFKIYCYNDGSKDQSLSILKALSNQNTHLKVIDKENSGHGPTILQGYKTNLDTDWLFQIDSDNELKAAEFDTFWEARTDCDFIIGNRIQRKSPMARVFVTQVSRWVVKLFYGSKIKDVNTPYRLIRVETFKEAIIKIPDDTFAPNLIISGLASLKNRRVKQFDIVHHSRQTGEGSIKKWNLIKAVFKSFWQTIVFRFKLKS